MESLPRSRQWISNDNGGEEAILGGKGFIMRAYEGNHAVVLINMHRNFSWLRLERGESLKKIKRN
jgi:hypothetical protein